MSDTPKNKGSDEGWLIYTPSILKMKNRINYLKISDGIRLTHYTDVPPIKICKIHNTTDLLRANRKIKLKTYNLRQKAKREAAAKLAKVDPAEKLFQHEAELTDIEGIINDIDPGDLLSDVSDALLDLDNIDFINL